jgi:hypothetical protein
MKKYGDDIKKTESAYRDLLTTAEQKQFKKEHPELKAYWDEKKVYQEKLDKRIVVLGSNLPEAPKAKLRTDQPQNPNSNQKAVQGAAQEQPQISWEQWQNELGAPMSELIQGYWQGEKLPSPVRSQLNSMAKNYGYYNGDDMLQAILMSMQ